MSPYFYSLDMILAGEDVEYIPVPELIAYSCAGCVAERDGLLCGAIEDGCTARAIIWKEKP